MSNVITFPVQARVLGAKNAHPYSAQIVSLTERSRDGAYHLYVQALQRAVSELRLAQAAGKRRRVNEWKDEIDVVRLHSEWCGYRDIAGQCRNLLQAG
ncbi:hypothetical protein BJF93_15380 [Xaviernesmea oryzae]|uniref:Uncharacterized protein n=1 Tax=Xaviernesmea oryzae TaxID=464029 RepID=A0A1Q9AY25_9HYPH|nr:hypothetical protein [Xaviernesmea oryzae]OLP60337.1 hypothetical protein BJF93_15380 [Xaviernesmea oryzae]